MIRLRALAGGVGDTPASGERGDGAWLELAFFVRAFRCTIRFDLSAADAGVSAAAANCDWGVERGGTTDGMGGTVEGASAELAAAVGAEDAADAAWVRRCSKPYVIAATIISAMMLAAISAVRGPAGGRTPAPPIREE